MLEPNKGLYKQTSWEKTPQGAWIFARNVVVGRSLRDVSNEHGFELITDPGDFGGIDAIIIGRISFTQEVVIFSVTSGGEGIIGILDEFNNYAIILRSTGLNFKKENPIRGDFIRNFAGERIITWWDGLEDDANPPRVLNIDCIPFELNVSKEPVDLADLVLLKLFPDLGCLDITLNAVNDGGGRLETGAYYIARAFVHPDGSVTNYSPPSNPIFIYDDAAANRYDQVDGAPAGTTTSKSITVTFNNLSEEFTVMNIALISKIGGVLSARVIQGIKYTGTSKEVTISGEEQTFPAAIEDVIVPNASYTRVHAGTFHENRLHLGNVKKETPLDYQPYANAIETEWVREEDLNLGKVEGSYKDPVVLFDMKGFALDEVYGFVTAFGLLDGTISKWFHIPGKAPGQIGIAAYVDTDLISTINGTNPDPKFDEALMVDSNAKYYQMFNSAKSNGEMGYWENYDEVYPDTDCSDIKNAAGQVVGTLRNKRVRHHKFPSVNQLNAWGNPFYTQSIDDIGAFFFQVPNGLASTWSGLDFDFAAQFPSWNIHGNGVLSVPLTGVAYFDVTTTATVDVSIRLRITGNSAAWMRLTILNASGAIIFQHYLNIDGDLFNLADESADFDLSAINMIPGFRFVFEAQRENTIDAPSVQFGINAVENNFNEGFTTGKIMGVKFKNINVPAEIADKVTCQYFGFLKRTAANSTKVAMTGIDYFPEGDNVLKDFKIRDFDLSNVRPGVITNYLKTNFYFDVADVLGVGVQDSLGGYTLNKDRTYDDTFRYVKSAFYDPRIYFDPDGEVFTEDEYRIETETDYLFPDQARIVYGTLYRYLKNCYQDYTTQSVAIMGNAPIANEVTMYSGDVHINYQSLVHRLDSNIEWALLHYVIENVLNVELRHGEEGKPSPPRDLGKFDLQSTDGVGEGAFNWYLYNSDYTSLNDLVPQVIFECTDKCVEENEFFPVRVTRSLATNNEDGVSTWRTFKVNEYYDMEERDKGDVYVLAKYGGSLIIHQFYSMFVANVKDIITTNDTDLFVGRGDIFDRPPREIVVSGSSNAYGGCQSLWGNMVTKHGYIFWDMLAGKVFVFKGELKEISNDGLRYFLENNSSLATGLTNFVDNPWNGEGLTMGYDEKENRLLITKIQGEPGTIGNTQSFTFSYSFHRNLWVARHDYIPNGYFDNRTGEFCIMNPGDWSQGLTNPRVFKLNNPARYGVYFKDLSPSPVLGDDVFASYIDFVFAVDVKDDVRFMNVMWETEAYELDGPEKKTLYGKTLTQIMTYDYFRCSGLVDLSYNRNHRLDNLRRIHSKWQFNDFRDIVIDKDDTIITEQGTINLANLKNSKIFFKKSKFIGKFIVVRLQVDNLEQIGIDLNAATVSYSNSER